MNLHVKPFTKEKIQTDAAFSAVSNMFTTGKKFVSIWNDSTEWHMLHVSYPFPRKKGVE